MADQDSTQMTARQIKAFVRELVQDEVFKLVIPTMHYHLTFEKVSDAHAFMDRLVRDVSITVTANVLEKMNLPEVKTEHPEKPQVV